MQDLLQDASGRTNSTFNLAISTRVVWRDEPVLNTSQFDQDAKHIVGELRTVVRLQES